MTRDQDKLVKIGAIKYTKDRAFVSGVSNQSKGKNKFKDLKQQRENENKHSDTGNSSSTDEDSRSKRMKNKRERPTCGYCKGSHHERSCFRKKMDIMTKLLKENHIDLPYFARGWECKQGSGKPEHALSAWVKPISIFSISDIPYDIS